MKKPTSFGKYTLLERINVGGMAEVFRAKAFGVEGFERLVAVKRILPAIAEDKEFIRMFIDEAKLAVQLNHANIAQIFDLGVVDNSHYIALEHVHGRDLRAIYDRCRSQGEPMPIAQACFILMKVCEGLDYAHNKRDQSGRELGLVHRDVSPQNVLVSFEGEIKLIDFGIAKAVGQQSGKTQAGILKGKFGYMSPEQVRGMNVDRRSDIFSCGIVLYELLTNERVFVGETDFATLEKVRNVEILPPTTYNRRIPEELERIVLKALTLNPTDRYQNAIDLHDELQAFVYAAGEFYSRKDLAGWMKKMFAREIAEESARLEEYRNVQPDGEFAPTPARGRSTSVPPPRKLSTTKPPPPPTRRVTGPVATASDATQSASPASRKQLEWDDEELETQIYDTPDEQPRAVRESRPMRTAYSSESGASGRMARASVPPVAGGESLAGSESSWRARPSAPPMARSHTLEPGAPTLLADGPGFGVGSVRALGPTQPPLARSASRAVRRTPWLWVIPLVALAGAGAVASYVLWNKRSVKAPVATADTVAGFDLFVAPSEGVKWKLDGIEQEAALPAKIRVTPGKHRITIEAPSGYMNHSQEVEVEPSKVARIDVALRPRAVRMRFQSDPPGARVRLSGNGEVLELGTTPLERMLDPQQSYEALFTKDGHVSLARPVTFAGTATDELKVSLSKDETSDPGGRPGGGVAVIPVRGVPSRGTPGTTPATTTTPPNSGGGGTTTRPVEPPVRTKVVEGVLQLSAKPPCEIFINGRNVGLRTPQPKIVLPAGVHRVTLINNEFGIRETFSVTIAEGETSRVVKDYSKQLPETP